MWSQPKGGETALDVTCMCTDHQYKVQRQKMWPRPKEGEAVLDGTCMWFDNEYKVQMQ